MAEDHGNAMVAEGKADLLSKDCSYDCDSVVEAGTVAATAWAMLLGIYISVSSRFHSIFPFTSFPSQEIGTSQPCLPKRFQSFR